jgi:hypothetical protein
MRIQRIAFTTIIAALIWPVLLVVRDHPITFFMLKDLKVAVYLEVMLMASTVCSIRCVDAVDDWRSAKMRPAGLDVMGTRFLIAAITALLFALPFSILVAGITETPYGYMNALMNQGFTVVGATWLSTIIVDLLVRNYRT